MWFVFHNSPLREFNKHINYIYFISIDQLSQSKTAQQNDGTIKPECVAKTPVQNQASNFKGPLTTATTTTTTTTKTTNTTNTTLLSFQRNLDSDISLGLLRNGVRNTEISQRYYLHQGFVTCPVLTRGEGRVYKQLPFLKGHRLCKCILLKVTQHLWLMFKYCLT